MNRCRPSQSGFTLLEVLVAVALAAIILAITYGALSQVLKADETARQRQEQLQQWLFIQRLLLREGSLIMPGRAAAFELAEDELMGRYQGAVIPGMRMGAELTIRYHWESTEENSVRWVRDFQASREEAANEIWRVSVGEGLQQVRYEVLTRNGWIAPEDFVAGSIRALRWYFNWSLIGEWQLIVPVESASL